MGPRGLSLLPEIVKTYILEYLAKIHNYQLFNLVLILNGQLNNFLGLETLLNINPKE